MAERIPKAAAGSYNSIAAQYAQAKARKEAEDLRKGIGLGVVPPAGKGGGRKTVGERLNEVKEGRFKSNWSWVAGVFLWLLFIHSSGIYFFTKGFLLTRLVLEEKSSCSDPPLAPGTSWKGAGTPEGGCWHPKTFDKVVVILIDALRYDFTVPFANTSTNPGQAFHNALPFLYDTAVAEPHNAFLLPFIADPPTTTLQRLKGLTTGTLPTFVDAGSNFAGTAIEEDNLLQQLKDAGKKIAHLGDDTWTALFPGYFEPSISRAYDSLNVWDLHTLDNGVTEHIFPLLQDKKGEWDVLIAHFLGVDHAGHRYGPNHPAMTGKLQQMDGLLRDVVEGLGDDTLLVVMGDHGMDAKGDHGGESDDEVEAALWMYSKKGIFGRTRPEFVTPPANAKVRPVNQIDLVPTLALLLGLPIPFNNLGRPIEDAFAGKSGKAWENLANVGRMAAAGIKRYQAAYYVARGIEESTLNGSPHALWAAAEMAHSAHGNKEQMYKDAYQSFSAFQEETLRICRSLWARFDVPSMLLGIGILAAGVVVMLLYANSNAEDGDAVEDEELERAEAKLEFEAFAKGEEPVTEESSSLAIIKGVAFGSAAGIALGSVAWFVQAEGSPVEAGAAGASVGGLVGALAVQFKLQERLGNPLPKTIWGWLAFVFTVTQSIGFASNSYTIWEDSILLFFLSTFGAISAVSSLRQEKLTDRSLGVYHSILFIMLGWGASFSKLCREEQMPYCQSTYYASATSSTSAPWQLVIPFVLVVLLPEFIKGYYKTSLSYQAWAPQYISWAFRSGLLFNAIFWTLDAADDGEWFKSIPSGTLKAIRVFIAQAVFGAALIAGSWIFGIVPLCISVSTIATGDSTVAPGEEKRKPLVTILGFANVHGSRYFLLVLNIALTVLLVQKPMGAGAIALMLWQILSLVEIIDLNRLSNSPIGPVILALLGSFHFFKTGHQATLSSIQWESAFVPLHTIQYPWSPLLVALNTFGAQILAVVAVPLVVFWKQKPKKKGLLRGVGRALAWHILYYAVTGLATTMWAGWLRRHLMLYRIFSPKFMCAAFVLIVVDVVGLLVALMGSRYNIVAVGEVFGWA